MALRLGFVDHALHNPFAESPPQLDLDPVLLLKRLREGLRLRWRERGIEGQCPFLFRSLDQALLPVRTLIGKQILALDRALGQRSGRKNAEKQKEQRDRSQQLSHAIALLAWRTAAHVTVAGAVFYDRVEHRRLPLCPGEDFAMDNTQQ